MRVRRRFARTAPRRAMLVAGVFAALLISSAQAWGSLIGLPAGGGRLNEDPAAGIPAGQSVSGQDPANADLADGSLNPATADLPWAIFQQQEAGGAHDQVFTRALQGGGFVTKGMGTEGGRSSAAPVFSGSLNFDQSQDGEAPSIDFAGAGRAIPWASWYEDTSGTGFGSGEIFASRFDALSSRWIFGGQGRGTGGGTVPVPSLNIHTNQEAENPSIAGGSTSDPTKPAPWVAWQETTSAPVNGMSQIFVSKALGPGMANCDGVTPAGSTEVAGHVPAVGGFCWQDVGVGRVGSGSADPSLSVDPTRNAEEPAITFTGTNDSVPWVVWYESGTSSLSGLRSNEMVFAARATAPSFASPPSGTVVGGFDWTAVGAGSSGVLDGSGSPTFGPCAQSAAAEAGCSLNVDPEADAGEPRVAAGTMTPGTVTVPWVVWDEQVGAVRKLFVARLLGGRFQLANGGAPIAVGSGDAARPDITFSHNTPYISWRESSGGVATAFTGHFVNAEAPTFVLDDPTGTPISPLAAADVREPISSSCAATPFNGDGSACQGGAIGTPLSLLTSGSPLRGLFAQAYQPNVVTTGAASSVGASSAVIPASVSLGGSPTIVRFEYGPSTAYGASTPDQLAGPAPDPASFAATLAGLAPGTTIHYRAVAVTDFGLLAGADATFTTLSKTSHSEPHRRVLTVKLKLLTKRLREALKSHKLKLQLTLSGAGQVSLKVTVKTIAGRLSRRVKRSVRTIVIATAKLSFKAGARRTLTVRLSKSGRRLLAHARHAKLTITATAKGPVGAHGTATLAHTLKR